MSKGNKKIFNGIDTAQKIIDIANGVTELGVLHSVFLLKETPCHFKGKNYNLNMNIVAKNQKIFIEILDQDGNSFREEELVYLKGEKSKETALDRVLEKLTKGLAPEESLRVFFRKFKEDDALIAVFPTWIDGPNGELQSYMHTGQHSQCTKEAIDEITLPTDAYEGLLAELVSQGYNNLEVVEYEPDGFCNFDLFNEGCDEAIEESKLLSADNPHMSGDNDVDTSPKNFL